MGFSMERVELVWQIEALREDFERALVEPGLTAAEAVGQQLQVMVELSGSGELGRPAWDDALGAALQGVSSGRRLGAALPRMMEIPEVGFIYGSMPMRRGMASFFWFTSVCRGLFVFSGFDGSRATLWMAAPSASALGRTA